MQISKAGYNPAFSAKLDLKTKIVTDETGYKPMRLSYRQRRMLRREAASVGLPQDKIEIYVGRSDLDKYVGLGYSCRFTYHSSDGCHSYISSCGHPTFERILIAIKEAKEHAN